MKNFLSAALLTFALCAALPLSVSAAVYSAVYSSDGNVRITGSGTAGESYIVGVYDSAGEVAAIGNAVADSAGRYDVTLIAGIQQGNGNASYEVRAYSQDNSNAPPSVAILNVPGISGGGGSVFIPDYRPANNPDRDPDGGAGSWESGGDNAVQNDGIMPSDGEAIDTNIDYGAFIGSLDMRDIPDFDDMTVNNEYDGADTIPDFGGVPQTGIPSIGALVIAMCVSFVVSVFSCVYLLSRCLMSFKCPVCERYHNGGQNGVAYGDKTVRNCR